MLVTERLWESLEARLSRGVAPPLRVLVAANASDPAQDPERLLTLLLTLLPLPAGSQVYVLAVLDPSGRRVPAPREGAAPERDSGTGEAAEAHLAPPGLRITHGARRGVLAAEVAHAAAAFRPDLLVVGSRGRGGTGCLPHGSAAENVARHASTPVLVLRAPFRELRRVLVAVDGSEYGHRAVCLAGHLPLPRDTRVVLCNVVRPYYIPMGPEPVVDIDEIVADLRKQAIDDAERLLSAAAWNLEQWGKQVAIQIRHGDPAGELLDLAAEGPADLVITGARGHSALHGLIMGSVADRLLKKVHCSVLIAR